ncbi:MAG: ECF-type sigma factor [Bryobacteraceae bacterium]
MVESRSEEASRLLEKLNHGDAEVRSQFVRLVYDELHGLAEDCLRRNPDQMSIQPTELVNEAYLKLIGARQRDFQSRGHFLGVAAHAMRCIIVDRIRAKKAARRGGQQFRVDLEEPMLVCDDRRDEALALDEALHKLEALDAEQAQIVELRYFGGLTLEEIVTVTQKPLRTVERELQHARRWLYLEMTRASESGA